MGQGGPWGTASGVSRQHHCLSLHCWGDPLCFPPCRRDLRSPHALTVTPVSRENTVRETRRSCNPHVPVGYGRFHRLSHLTRRSITLQLSHPHCSALCPGGVFDVSAIAELSSGKGTTECLLSTLIPCPASLVSIFTALCSARQPSRLALHRTPFALRVLPGDFRSHSSKNLRCSCLHLRMFLCTSHHGACLLLGAIAHRSTFVPPLVFGTLFFFFVMT